MLSLLVLLKELRMRDESNIFFLLFLCFYVIQENYESGGVQDSAVEPQWWKAIILGSYWAESYLESCQTSKTELSCENNQRL